MSQMKLVTTMLELIGKNAETEADRFNIPLAVYIIACQVNNIPKELAASTVLEAYDSIQLISERPVADDVAKH